jgi:TPR repeat protein
MSTYDSSRLGNPENIVSDENEAEEAQVYLCCECDDSPPQEDWDKGLIDKLYNKIMCGRREAWEFVQQNADAGDSLAQGIVAVCFESSDLDGCCLWNTDMVKCRAYALQAEAKLSSEAVGGNKYAQCFLGILYHRGILDDANPSKCLAGLEQVQQSAGQGCVVANYYMLMAKFLHWSPTWKNELHQIAKTGYAEAQYDYASFHSFYCRQPQFANTMQDELTESHWIQLAARQGHRRSKVYQLKQLRNIRSEIPIQAVMSFLDDVLDMEFRGTYFTAAELIGWKLRDCDAFMPDAVQALQWLQVASDLGDNRATYAIGFFCCLGYGVPKNKILGKEILHNALVADYRACIIVVCGYLPWGVADIADRDSFIEILEFTRTECNNKPGVAENLQCILERDLM